MRLVGRPRKLIRAETIKNPDGDEGLNPGSIAELRRVWDQCFAEPIVLDDGSKLLTLLEAIAHLGKIIPKSEHDMQEVQAAAHCLTQVA